ncbi:MAG: hypothetical protein ACREO7_08575 [Pseudoxanthomonas sp.]
MAMQKIRPLLFIFALLLFTSVPAIAADTPEQICEQYLAAIKQRGMVAVPDFIHPEELERFKDMLMPLFEESGPPNREELIRGFFGEEATLESVAVMAPDDFMRAFMGIADVQMKKLNISIGKTEILGSVKEGTTVHLITRATAGTGDFKLTQLEVASLKPSGDTWRLLLSGRLEGMAQALKAQSTKRPPQ